jgi:hypothetical protein
MTLQIGFVARDGFLIASDRRTVSGFGLPDNPGVRTPKIRTGGTRKIFVSEVSGLVCAFSGSDMSHDIAEKLISSTPSRIQTHSEIRTHLQRSEEFARALGQEPRGEMIIAGIPDASENTDKLWRIFFRNAPGYTATIMPIYPKLFGGDESNSAVFLGERYCDPSKTVEESQLLAAHVILEGSKVNSLSVGGLDILVAKDGEKPRFLNTVELTDLERRSGDVHDGLKKLFNG